MKKYWTILFTLSLIWNASTSQILTFGEKDLDSLLHNSDKPTMILLTAEWCKFCQMMKNEISKSQVFSNEINEKWNLLEFNSESREEIVVQNKTFNPSATEGGKHELALLLGDIDGKFVLPTTVFLNESGEIIFQNQSYLEVEKLLDLMQQVN